MSTVLNGLHFKRGSNFEEFYSGDINFTTTNLSPCAVFIRNFSVT